VLRLFEERHILDHVNLVGAYLWEKLEEFAGRHDCVTVHRGKGLIQGLEFDRPVGDIVKRALLEEKLVLISAGANVIRFVPPLVITQDHVDLMLEKLEASL
jgi:acetylornithine/N-succinyldiaminopimelate aminotransferase